MKSKNKINKKSNKSLKQRLIFLVVLCWSIPVLAVFLLTSISYQKGITKKTENLLRDELKNFAVFTSYKIDEAITISKNASYDKSIETQWRQYDKGSIPRASLYKTIKLQLKDKYYRDPRFNMSAFYLYGEEMPIGYSFRYSGGYKIYKEETEPYVLEVMNTDTSKPQVKTINGKVYIVRNLYTTSGYKKFATLAIELNIDKLFEDVSRNKIYSMGLYINQNDTLVTNDRSLVEDSDKSVIISKLHDEYDGKSVNGMNHLKDSKNEGYIYQAKFDDYHIGAVLVVEKKIIYAELRELRNIIILIITIVIPVIFYVIYFIYANITAPVEKLIDATRKIEKGKIGLQIEEGAMPNQEFSYLMDSYNKMSSELKFMFDYAYNEKLAKKDAKILALQSQINPHFLNNTLEMMNWQARMAGDITVSKMIESLSTLLDYSIGRDNKRLIHLFEEIRCADAYFYIISMRFGKRLQVEKNIDKSLMQVKVPQLIIQPLLENAVTHGVEATQKGIIKLNVYREEENVYLEVINTGKRMEKEDVKRVQALLNNKSSIIHSKDSKHVSLGIRNVNERIKLIYGDAYGLSIKSLESGETVAKICIPYEHIHIEEREEMFKNMFDLPKD